MGEALPEKGPETAANFKSTPPKNAKNLVRQALPDGSFAFTGQ